MTIIEWEPETLEALTFRERSEWSLQEKVYERAKTLFEPSPTGKPHNDYDYLYERVDKEVGRIYKPKADGCGDYTEHRYFYWYRHQTCSCPFFCGIEPSAWSDTFTVTREGHCVKTYDRTWAEVVPQQKPHGYCKHTLGFQYYRAFYGTLPPRKREE